jgi:hypothetical protein
VWTEYLADRWRCLVEKNGGRKKNRGMRESSATPYCLRRRSTLPLSSPLAAPPGSAAPFPLQRRRAYVPAVNGRQAGWMDRPVRREASGVNYKTMQKLLQNIHT